MVPAQNFGKVKIGQKVQVYLDNYPYEEFGVLSAIVEDFSTLPQQRFYRVVISFPNGLNTQYGKEVPTQQNLKERLRSLQKDENLTYNPLFISALGYFF